MQPPGVWTLIPLPAFCTTPTPTPTVNGAQGPAGPHARRC